MSVEWSAIVADLRRIVETRTSIAQEIERLQRKQAVLQAWQTTLIKALVVLPIDTPTEKRITTLE